MTSSEYETLAAFASARRLAGDAWGTIRADMEATRSEPFPDDEWAKIKFLAALDVAFKSVPKQTKSAPSDPKKPNTVIRIHQDSSGEFHMKTE